MEPADSHPAAALPSGLENPTDRLICGLLAAEPMSSPEIAERLAIPPRTARHRLMRLRDAGTVAVGNDGFYRLEALAAAALPASATPGGELAATGTTPRKSGSAALLAVVLSIALGCVGAAVWAAMRSASDAPIAQNGPSVPPFSPPWQPGILQSDLGVW
jgi:DNA-binding transcriptional ArsR family regulator